MVDSEVTVSVRVLAMAAPAKSAITEKRILILGIGFVWWGSRGSGGWG